MKMGLVMTPPLPTHFLGHPPLLQSIQINKQTDAATSLEQRPRHTELLRILRVVPKGAGSENREIARPMGRGKPLPDKCHC